MARRKSAALLCAIIPALTGALTGAMAIAGLGPDEHELLPELVFQNKILENLEHPFGVYGVSLLILSIPVIVFVLAKKLLFNPEEPGQGLLTPWRSKVLMYALMVVQVPIHIAVNVTYTTSSVFAIHVLGQTFDSPDSAEVKGGKIVFLAMIMLPMLLLMIFNQTISEAAVNRVEKATGRRKGTLPSLGMLLVIINVILMTLGMAAFYLLLGPDYIMAGFWTALPLMIPALLAFGPILARWHGSGPMSDTKLHKYITDVFQKFEVPLSRVYEASSSLKMMEMFMLPNARGPVQSYIDPELIKAFTRNEFYTILVHQIGHYKLRHLLKFSLACAVLFLIILITVGLSYFIPGLQFLSSGIAFPIIVGIPFILLVQWFKSMDKQADDFVLEKTGLYEDYLKAVIKMRGLDPDSINLAQLDQLKSIESSARNQIKHILTRWQEAYYKPNPPSGNAPPPK